MIVGMLPFTNQLKGSATLTRMIESGINLQLQTRYAAAGTIAAIDEPGLLFCLGVFGAV